MNQADIEDENSDKRQKKCGRNSQDKTDVELPQSQDENNTGNPH